MKSRFLASVNAGIAALLLLFTTVLTPLSVAYATPTGNNGTLKVHEIGTPTGTENNDPKVCAFNLEGFGFDPSQAGYVLIETQGGSQPVGQDAGPFSFGPTNGSGYAVTQDFNTAGGTTVVDGTYKATLFGKDTGGNIDLTDEKAKSKVFKVDCAPIVTPVTPAAVTFYDACGTANDTYTIPATTGVLYQIGDVTKAANTYPGSGTVAVTAIAAANYTLQGIASWEHTFTDVACPPTNVTPTVPVIDVDITCEEDGSYTIPAKTGVIYKVDGTATAAGTYYVSTPKTIVVTAEAATGYSIYGPASWQLTFHAPEDCEEPEDVCPNIDDIQTQVPDGAVLDNEGNCVTPGHGGETPTTPPVVEVITVAQPVYQTTPQTSPAKLVDTGVSTLQTTVIATALIGLAIGIAFSSRKNTLTHVVRSAKIAARR